MATMGQSIVFKGEMSGEEDLVIEGKVDGKITLSNYQLTIGEHSHITAEVTAKSIIVIGRVDGNLSASERIEIQSTGHVQGDLSAPKLSIQEGAVLNGHVDMSAGKTGTTQGTGSGTNPAEAPRKSA